MAHDQEPDLFFAVAHALEGLKWLRIKWEGEYGASFALVDGRNPIREGRLREIDRDIARLKAIKSGQKSEPAL